MPCMGHFNGDSIEQLWGSCNALGPFTRQMNNGHRQDVISAHFMFWNWLKTIATALRLSVDLVDAREQYKVARATFISLSVLYSRYLPGWRELETHTRVCEERGERQPSVYQHKVSDVPSRTSIYRQILASEDKRDTKASTRSTEAAFIVEALNIQHAQRRIAGKLTLNQTETVQHDIRDRRERLVTRIKAFRKLQVNLMPYVEVDVLKQEASEPEKECLFIPSDYSDSLERQEKGLQSLVELERTLRQGELYDAIEDVRQAAKNQSIVRDQKNKNDRGTKANTRSLLQLKTIYVDLLCCINDYNSTRKALCALGDGLDLPEMTEQDTYRKSTVHKRGLGDSRRTDGQLYTLNLMSPPNGDETQASTEVPFDDGLPGTQIVRRKRGSRRMKSKRKKTSTKGAVKESGWIWQPKVLFTGMEISTRSLKAYEKETDRVQWFRAQAERDRWRECIEKSEAEFRNSIRYFKKMAAAWKAVASGPAGSETLPTGSRWTFGHRAYAQRQAR
ncbi:hypothetical protein V5O48_019170, partial [Marasmius crinis-equi]